MLELRILNRKKMDLTTAFDYMKLYTPNKIKDEVITDEYSDEKIHIKRIYKVIDVNDILNEFKIELIENEFYITHEFKNPNAILDLDDGDDLF